MVFGEIRLVIENSHRMSFVASQRKYFRAVFVCTLWKVLRRPQREEHIVGRVNNVNNNVNIFYFMYLCKYGIIYRHQEEPSNAHLRIRHPIDACSFTLRVWIVQSFVCMCLCAYVCVWDRWQFLGTNKSKISSL